MVLRMNIRKGGTTANMLVSFGILIIIVLLMVGINLALRGNLILLPINIGMMFGTVILLFKLEDVKNG